MSTYPDNLKYAATHEWVRLEEDGAATVGISNHAQDALGDIVFVELPEVGATIHAKDEVAVVESVKAASDLYMPIDAEIVEGNAELEDAPEKVNQSAFEEGWIVKIKILDDSQIAGLLDATLYAEIAKD